jgi:hypothetical protein
MRLPSYDASGEVARHTIREATLDGVVRFAPPNLALVIRFEHMGAERFARRLGGGDWREPAALHRMFESVNTPHDDTGVGPAPPETIALWVKLSRRWDPASSQTSRRGRSSSGTARA